MIDRLITADDCRRVLTPAEVLTTVEGCLRIDGTSDITWPSPRNLNIFGDQAGNEYHFKACVLESAHVAGVRVVAHPPDEGSGSSTRFVLLIDTATTRPLALVDDSWTYAQRTVANLLLVAQRLAPPRVSKVAIIGAGTLARAALPYVQELFDRAGVAIASRREGTRSALAQEAHDAWGLQADATTPECSTREAQIVLTATGSTQAVLEDHWIEPGCVVGCVETAECGGSFFRRADARIVDSRQQLSSELEATYGADAPDLVDATMGEIVRGLHPGRRNPTERFLLISQGLVSQDVALAHRALELTGMDGPTSGGGPSDAPHQGIRR